MFARPSERRLPRSFLGRLGLVMVAAIVAVAVLAPWLAPYNPAAINVPTRLQAPSLAHPFGTDQLGRDVLSRVVIGTRIALETALGAVLLAAALGLALGLAAGCGPRWLDNLLVLLFDTVRSVPTVMLALVLVTLAGPSLATVMLVIVLGFTPGYARVARAQAQALAAREFVEAARAIGAGAPRILARHVGPNVVGPLIVLTGMDMPSAITVEAGLSFLGLGVRPPTPSWGSVLSDGYAFIGNTPWIILAGGLPLVVATLGFTFFGEALRDMLDPRTRQAISRR